MHLKLLSRHDRPITISGVCNDRDYFSSRKMVCEFILYFRAYINSIKWDLTALEAVIPEINKDVDALFDCIKQFFSTLRSIPDSTLLYAASNIGNKVIHIYFLFRKYEVILTNENISFYFSVSNQNSIRITCM